ncbi:S-adenosyl-L-methionine-dependent methyltransferase [Chytridium lagenaria]|nr:S-adenosyl-L-methionine-dependent methyltransferase [Chytridium lagenaria]
MSFFKRILIKPSRLPYIAGGFIVYCSSTYLAFHGYRLYRLPSPPEDIADPKAQSRFSHVYTGLASSYDKSIGWDEWLLGLHGKRSKLLKQAKGDVIELAAGTGRNMDHYPPKPIITSLTFTDSNSHMLEQAFNKYSTTDSHRTRLPPTMFSVLDGSSTTRPDASFDTVVDTFGLCSFSDPVACLKEMTRITRPNGRILLLEHGRSTWGWLNSALDKSALDHAKEWGCWWNRDIEALVKEAGLKIVSCKRYHFGTTYEIVATPA